MKYTKRGRKFLNTPNSECLGAVCWHVSVGPHWSPKKKGKTAFDAEIAINREGRSHYLCSEKNMYPIYNMRDELNKFIEACEQALKDVKE